MKREISSELLKEYLAGDPGAEEELYARYDRELQVSGDLWTDSRTAHTCCAKIRWLVDGYCCWIGFSHWAFIPPPS